MGESVGQRYRSIFRMLRRGCQGRKNLLTVHPPMGEVCFYSTTGRGWILDLSIVLTGLIAAALAQEAGDTADTAPETVDPTHPAQKGRERAPAVRDPGNGGGGAAVPDLDSARWSR